MLRELKQGLDACVTVTLVDGLVLAKSAFHHSMNYRSVVIMGRAAWTGPTSSASQPNWLRIRVTSASAKVPALPLADSAAQPDSFSGEREPIVTS